MLLSWWSLVSLTTSHESSFPQQERQLDNKHYVNDDDDDVNDNSWMRTHHDYNQTILTSTVTIRVTPRDDFLVSWSCLSAALMLAIIWAAWQVYKERNIDQTTPSSMSTGIINSGSGHYHHHHQATGGTTALHAGGGGVGTAIIKGGGRGEVDRLGESSSTAEVTRCVVSVLFHD